MALLRQILAPGVRRAPFISTAAALGALALASLPRQSAAAADDHDSATAARSGATVHDATTQTSTPSADPQALKRELEREEARIRALEQRLFQDQAALEKEPPLQPSTPTAPSGATAAGGTVSGPNALLGSFGPDGFVLRSAGGQNVIRLRGNLSLDYRYFHDSYDPATADTFLVRKARPVLEGTLDGIFDFRLMPDFAQGKTVLQDAWVDARFSNWFIPQIGKFKAPVGLERLQLEQFARFIEASLTADLLPYRDLGFAVNGNIGRGLFTYQVGVFDGAPDGGGTDANSVPDANSTGKFTWGARIFSRPFADSGWSALKRLGFGIAGTYVNVSGIETATSTVSLLAAYKTTGQQPLFSFRGNTATGFNNATIAQGIERRLVPQLNYYVGPFGVLGEYVKEDQQVFRQLSPTTSRNGTLDNHAWEVQSYVFLTGENETYEQLVVPKRSVGQGGFGAWEIAARYHELHFDSAAFAGGANSFANPATAVESARAVGAAINWYLTQNFKIQLDYEVTRFEGGAPAGNRPDERVLTSQFALIF